jgi:hypothetical protein
MTFSEELQRCKRLTASRSTTTWYENSPSYGPVFLSFCCDTPRFVTEPCECRSTREDRSKAMRAKADCMPEIFRCMAERRHWGGQHGPAVMLQPGCCDRRLKGRFGRDQNPQHAMPNKALIWINRVELKLKNTS